MSYIAWVRKDSRVAKCKAIQAEVLLTTKHFHICEQMTKIHFSNQPFLLLSRLRANALCTLHVLYRVCLVLCDSHALNPAPIENLSYVSGNSLILLRNLQCQPKCIVLHLWKVGFGRDMWRHYGVVHRFCRVSSLPLDGSLSSELFCVWHMSTLCILCVYYMYKNCFRLRKSVCSWNGCVLVYVRVSNCLCACGHEPKEQKNDVHSLMNLGMFVNTKRVVS